MIRTLSLATVLAAALALPAIAQAPVTKVDPGTGPTNAVGDQVPQMKGNDAAAPVAKPDAKASPAAPIAAPMTAPSAGMVLSETEAKSWIGKPVYSSDGKNLGEVVDFQRDAAGNVIGMHAGIGGYLGLGQTRVSIMSSQFKLQGDRVVLEVTEATAKDLPKVSNY
jgi:hypothetical protein